MVHDTVQVLNFTGQQRTFVLYGADLVQSIGGGLAPTQASDKQREVGAWIRMDSTNVVLGPRGNRTIGFTVAVPEIAPPGDHLGAVVAATTTTPAQAGALSVESRVALTVRVRIPGIARLDGAVGPLRAEKASGGRRFTVEVHNTGNLLFTIGGRVDVTRGSETVASVQILPNDIYIIPGGVSRFEGTWTSPPAFGSRTATAVFKLSAFKEPDATRKSAPVTLSFFSWLVALIGLVVLLGAAAAFVARRRSTASSGRLAARVEELEPTSSGEWYS
jgi:hypothetical protein